MPRTSVSDRRWLGVLVLAFVVLGVIYSFVTPAFESPDEVGHFAYVSHLLTTHSLPVQRAGDFGEAHQPPLYYLIAALAAAPADMADQTGELRPNPQFMWAGQGGQDVNIGAHGSAESFPFRGRSLALHLARVSSVLMGALSVTVTVLIAWRIFPGQPKLGLLAGALVAFNPQFLFISSSVNNDNLLVALATLGWWQVLRARERPEQRWQWAYAGALIGAGFMAKLGGGLVIGLVAGIGLLTSAWERRSLRLLVHGTWSAALVAVLVSGWWFARNLVLYGDVLGWKAYQAVFAVNLRNGALSARDLREFFAVQFRSFWGVFGWMNVPSPKWIYWVFGALCLLGLLGLAFRALRAVGQRGHLRAAPAVPLALLLAAVVAQEAYMLAVITRCNASCYQGRYLFPAIAPLMIFLSWGLMSLLPRRWARPVSALTTSAVVLALVSIAAFVPAKVLSPAYRVVPIPAWRLWFVRHKTEADFGAMFRLRGYDLHMQGEGTAAVLTLYWQALQQPDFDYSAFAHLIDGSSQVVSQKDHAPGEGDGYRPTAWWPGDIVADEHRIEIPSGLPPGTYRLRIGLYNWATGEQLPVLVDGEHVGTFIILDDSVLR